MEKISSLVNVVVDGVNRLEGGTWGGRVDLVFLVIVVGLLIVNSSFHFITELITACVARHLGVSPKPYLPQPRSAVRDVLLAVLAFVVSFFTVWYTRL